jgi:hypothetical protein
MRIYVAGPMTGMSAATASNPLERSWHPCQNCQHCDGTKARPCSWSAFNDGSGHQDAACFPRCRPALKRRKRTKAVTP